MQFPKDVEKVSLLYNCRALIYSSLNEHFGIVPLEAVYFRKPVFAMNSEGPTEKMVNNVTGFLCETISEALAMLTLVLNPELGETLGERDLRQNYLLMPLQSS